MLSTLDLLAIQKSDANKFSQHENVFDFYKNLRNKFDVQFYLITIFLIIFNLEAMFLFPEILSLAHINLMSLY